MSTLRATPHPGSASSRAPTRARHGRRHLAPAATALLLAGSSLSWSAAPSEAARAADRPDFAAELRSTVRPVVRPAAAGLSGCGATQVQEVILADASRYTCAGHDWRFRIPADSSPATPRRTEVAWADARPGQTITASFTVRGRLGPAAWAKGNWHTLWQLHGPTNGQWRPPAMTLGVTEGRLVLEGGSGHPSHSWSGANYWWRVPLAGYADDRSYQVVVQTHLSSDPSDGWVSVTVNGKRLLERWRPVSSSGLRPGTVYPGQPVVASRNGLYRGSQPGASRPTYEQSVLMHVVRVV